MSAKLKYLYDLREDLSLSLTPDQIVSTIVFGDNHILGFYDPTHTYNKGDKIAYIDENNMLKILECIRTGATGDPINLDDWREYSIIGTLDGIFNDLIIHNNSETAPVDKYHNKVWIKLKD